MLDAVLTPDVCQRATRARDPRFDGLFFVGITTTKVYCRPICPARVTYPERRRFFTSAAAAERAGYRPCLRCRPELAPGRALCDAVSRLATQATDRITAGALNGHAVADLAAELGVSERHLRRAMERELGVSPIELAQTQRLLLAKRLLADTDLSITRVAFASGFQSLRRFNSVFRERYRMAPRMLRRDRRPSNAPFLRLTLAYRPPLAWTALLASLRREAISGVELVQGRRYARTVSVDGRSGVILATDEGGHVAVDLSPSLVPVVMPLLSRLRHLFDLDAEPAAVDALLAEGGLGDLVRERPGLRLPGAVDGFEVALRTLLRRAAPWRARPRDLARHFVRALGEPVTTGIPGLTRLTPTPERVAQAGVDGLLALGVSDDRAEALIALARLMATGRLRLEPHGDVGATREALAEIPGIGAALATTIAMRALYWPDALAASDRALQRAAGVSSARELLVRAEAWRPWRAYAALHMRAARRV